jgi:hypothetical protein
MISKAIVIKLLLILFFFNTILNAASFKLVEIAIEADFTLENTHGKTSKRNKFSYSYMVFYNDKFSDNKRMYCFYSKKQKQVTKELKKPSHRICLVKNEKKFIYYVDKHNRYSKSDNHTVDIQNMNLKVTNIKTKTKCENNGLNFKDFNQKIITCLQKV